MTDEQQIPIDIHSSKLLEWLLSRRHCNRDWQKHVMTIREKISAAIQDMPEDERIVQLLQGSYINYFLCIRIVDILKDTEKNTKNFLGYYSSQRMNDWMQIQQMYEKGNVYLAEAAQILQRMVQYEIPVLKKQISKSDQMLADCARKEKDYAKQAVDSKKQYERELSKMGIKGDHLHQEILSLLAELPTFLEEITKLISSLDEPLRYYELFREYLHQRGAPNVVLLPLCRLLMRRGAEVTAYEWKHGVKPKRVELPSLDTLTDVKEENNGAEDEIDFGDDSAVPEGEIDFGDNGFQIEVVGDEKGTVDDGVARDLDALTILENPHTRQLIYFELRELEKFLVIRRTDDILELASLSYIAGLEERPAALKRVTIEKIDSWLEHLNYTMNRLCDSQKAHLFRIRSSPQYVEKLVEALEQKRALEGRYEKMKALMIEKQNEIRIKAQKAQESLNGICEATKILQKEIEEDISKRYNGRKVNIMGGINAALMTSV